MRLSIRALLSLLLCVSLSAPLFSQRKKKGKKGDEEPPTQVLEALPDPPAFAIADVTRLGYLVSPLSSKGLLSQQTRDAVRALLRASRGAQIVKLRAFVAGTGDLRRVQTIVAEEFVEKKQPLPALSVIQVGALALEGAQVLMEAATTDKRPANPQGVAFLSGQQVLNEDAQANPLGPVLPQAKLALDRLKQAAEGVSATSNGMLRVTCLLSSLADGAALQQYAAQLFPAAVYAMVQLQRGPTRGVAECEGVARLTTAPAEPKLLNPAGLTASPNYSQAAVTAGRVALTGAQSAFGSQDKDARLAFDRLRRVLEAAKTTYGAVLFTSFYPLTAGSAERIRAVRFEYLDKTRPPASTLILFEGLPSLDATFAIEAVAAIP